jgi:hypothetical protein
MESVASGTDGQGTLMWLLAQKPYDHINNGLTPDELGPDVLFDSFQYVLEPNGKLLTFCTDKLGDTKTGLTLTQYLMNALAAWGTDQSLRLYQKYAPFYGSPKFLIRHRNKIETLTVLIKQLKALDEVKAGVFIDELCGDVYYEKSDDKYPLPDFARDGKSAAAAADVLDEFLRDSGTAHPSAKQRDAISAIVTKLRAKAAQ